MLQKKLDFLWTKKKLNTMSLPSLAGGDGQPSERSLCRLCLSRGAELWKRNIDVSGVVKQVVYSGLWSS